MPSKVRLGEILLKTNVLATQQLDAALTTQKKTGDRLGNILSANNTVSHLSIFKSLAEQHAYPFCLFTIETFEKEFDPQLLKQVTHQQVFQHQAVPASLDDDTLTLLTANPDDPTTIAFYKQHFNVNNIHQVIITERDIMTVCQHYFQKQILNEAILGLHKKSPELSAYHVFSKGQTASLAIFLMVLLAWLYFDVRSLVITSYLALQMFYIVTIAYRAFLSAMGVKNQMNVNISEEDIATLSDKDLPTYTILVPVYKEPEVIPDLINSLKNLDYPHSKLDVLLLLEEDDPETLAAAKQAHPPGNWHFLIVPNSQPKTKPKACNYGLQFAKGDYLVIFDAEDIPDSDQLKSALIAHKKLGNRCLCIQAALNYYNVEENFITKLFTLEYSYQYDYLLPGLDYYKLPIPLGGTSNHFVTKRLKDLGAWDPFNTTEDADLGIRAAFHNLQIGVIDSTTMEEATSTYWNWVRQRSRWLKGFMQTVLVYSRHPIQYIREMGLRNWLSFVILLGGPPLMLIANPIIWVVCLYAIFAPPERVFTVDLPPIIVYMGIFNLAISNFLGIYLSMLGIFKRRLWKLLPISLLNPFYWLFCHSVAAYKALWQLFAKPFYWEKTHHGLSHFKTPGK